MIQYTFRNDYTRANPTDYSTITITYPNKNSIDSSATSIFHARSVVAPREYTISTNSELLTEIVKVKNMKKLDCSWRDVILVTLDTAKDYTPGDAIGIFAPNPSDQVVKLMSLCGYTNTYCKIVRSGSQPFAFEGMLMDFFTYEMDISSLPRKLLLHKLSASSNKREHLEYLCSPEGTKDYLCLAKGMNTLVELIEAFECQPTHEELIQYCDLIKPRYYSLVNRAKQDSEIIVGVIRKQIANKISYGHASGMIKEMEKSGKCEDLKICIRRNTLMEGIDKTRMLICFCTGTGIAPFISLHNNSEDPEGMCLIYGYRNDEDDLTKHYNLKCRVFRAKSSEGVYVQSYLRVIEEYQKGCSIFICGNLKMQRDTFNGIKQLYPKLVEEKRVFFDNWR